MAILAAVRSERRAGIRQNIADVSLIDGSKDARSNAAELGNATVPITLFYRSDEAFTSFKERVGRSSFLFMCLSGDVEKDGSVKVIPNRGNPYLCAGAAVRRPCPTES